MKTLTFILLFVSSQSFTLPRIPATSGLVCVRQPSVPSTPYHCDSALYSKLFKFPCVATCDRNTSVRRTTLRKHRLFLSSATVLLFRPSHAFAAAISLPKFRTIVRPVLFALALGFSISSLISTIQTRKRQAHDATSEWGRYAMQPAARGRAVMMIFLRLIPYWLRIVLFAKNEEQKSQLRARSGVIFADSLLMLGPLYIKLGQILSCRDNLLPSEWSTAMERLQDKVPAKSGREALELAYSAFGSPEHFHSVISDFDTVPLAAASLGQVHRATLRTTNETVAIKLQRPRLREIYDQDLALLTKIARTVDSIGKRGNVGGVSQSWTQIFDDAKDILYREIDYRDEAENCMRFNSDFGLGKGGVEAQATAKSLDQNYLPSAAKWVRAPYVYQDLSSERALIMEFVPSIKITNRAKLDAANVTMESREYLADSLARVYLRSFCANRFFSTDPHPGNLGVEILANGMPRLVMYDFGQACALKSDQAEGILDVIEAIIDYDADRCVDAFAKMGVLKNNANLTSIRLKVQDNFDTGKVIVKQKKLKKSGYKFKEKPAANPDDSEQVDRKKTKDSEVMSYFQLPSEYAFVARALSQMDGVGKTLDPDFDFISSSAPYLVEIKGAGNYLKDEWIKWVEKVQTSVFDWQKQL